MTDAYPEVISLIDRLHRHFLQSVWTIFRPSASGFAASSGSGFAPVTWCSDRNSPPDFSPWDLGWAACKLAEGGCAVCRLLIRICIDRFSQNFCPATITGMIG